MVWLLAALKVPTPLGKLGNFVWEDVNKNGIQDDSEKGIQNVRLSYMTVQHLQTYLKLQAPMRTVIIRSMVYKLEVIK